MFPAGVVSRLFCRSLSILGIRRRVALASLAVFGAVIVLSSCHVRLIGDYDDTIDQGVSGVQQTAELYFAKLKSTPDTTFDQGVYDDIDSRLAMLKSRAAALPKYPIIVTEIANLKLQFATFQKVDKGAHRPISPAIVEDGEAAIAVSVESILKLELALKRGNQSPPALTANP